MELAKEQQWWHIEPADRARCGMHLDAWRDLPAEQQPAWPNSAAVTAVTDELARIPPLVSVAECDQLKKRLSAVARGDAFILQGGDCAETFAGSTERSICAKLSTLLQMGSIFGRTTNLPVVTIGRMAGQFAKPRSHDNELRDGIGLPVYRGDAINAQDFTSEARMPDPQRLLRAYHYSAAILNLCRTLGTEFRLAEFYSSHEALILEYERALTRIDQLTKLPYDVSAHFLWIGDRTRMLDGAHVEFVRHLRNPIGVKLGPSARPDDVLSLIDCLDPEREPGRLTFITRMGASQVRSALLPIVEKVKASGARVVWVCDPMHGNTFKTPDGRKTRLMADILAEVTGFFEIHSSLGTHPGGIHIEFTGDDVTECVGGSYHVSADDLWYRYETACDPRLNRNQALELVHRVSLLYRNFLRPAVNRLSII